MEFCSRGWKLSLGGGPEKKSKAHEQNSLFQYSPVYVFQIKRTKCDFSRVKKHVINSALCISFKATSPL